MVLKTENMDRTLTMGRARDERSPDSWPFTQVTDHGRGEQMVLKTENMDQTLTMGRARDERSPDSWCSAPQGDEGHPTSLSLLELSYA